MKNILKYMKNVEIYEICEKYIEKYIKVRDRWHISDNYRDFGDQVFNANYRLTLKIPFIFL